MGKTLRRGSKNFIPKTEPIREKRKQSYNQYKGIVEIDDEEWDDEEWDEETLDE